MELGNYLEKLENRAKIERKGIHSYAHEVVKEICDWFGVKEFGLWLGVAKRIGAGELKAKLDYCKEKGIHSPNYLLACTRKKWGK